MTLVAGNRLGPYEIVGLLGTGGMGEVYRARDSRLNRDVAIKVLPQLFGDDPERLARFDREAKTLAALNHPHIAHVYGLEQSGTASALVMELVEGDDLAQRIARGPLAVEDALPIARQIIDALEAAHEHGIVHRDLKPANIKVRPDGAVKVLDFGLAKAMDGGGATVQSDAANLPTITSPAMTRAGVIIGTAAYMSPEQARAKTVDKRADIWAFGCTLFEMLAGTRAFGGDDVTDTMTSVLRDAPDWNALPSTTPHSVRTLLARCLEKDPRVRLRDIGEARIALLDDQRTASSSDGGQRRRPLWQRAAALAGSAALGAVSVGTAAWLTRPAPSFEGASRLTIPLPSGLNITGQSPIAITPDGRTLVLQANRGRFDGLYRRSLDRYEIEPIAGSESGATPVISPDGQWVLFQADGYYTRVRLSGGPPERVALSAESYVPSWSPGGGIVFSSIGGLFRVPAANGTAQLMTAPDQSRGEVRLMRPNVSPDGRLVLHEVQTKDGSTHVGVTVAATGERRLIGPGRLPRWGVRDHVLYQNEGTWWAAPFDNRALTVTGPAFPILQASDGGNATDVAFTDSTLAYVVTSGKREAQLVWVDRTGKRTAAFAAAAYETPRLSPDDSRLAVVIAGDARSDLWIYDLSRGSRVRLTTAGPGRRPSWSPDGNTLAYQSPELGTEDIFVTPANGSSPGRSLLSLPGAQFPDAWSPDGTHIAYSEGTPSPASRDIFVVARGGGDPVRVVSGPAHQRAARFSPDGKWLAYVSDESGRDEVYAIAFPGAGDKIAVSTDGGTEPVWSRDGKELFYKAPNALMAVPIELQPFRPGKPIALFELFRGMARDSNQSGYDVTRDGRFIMVEEKGDTFDEIRIVFNWFDEALRKAAPSRATP